jgi:four helix bundle protein
MGKSEEKGLETLQIWQRSLAFAAQICREVLPKLPASEKWALADQLRRSAQSTPANIAEGDGRFYYQESVRFCYIARGSLEETFSHLTLARHLDYLPEEAYLQNVKEIQELRKMLNGYISFLKQSKRGATEPGATASVREDTEPYLIEGEFPEA